MPGITLNLHPRLFLTKLIVAAYIDFINADLQTQRCSYGAVFYLFFYSVIPSEETVSTAVTHQVQLPD